ncbi:uncharacterized protein LOC127081169 [Lathyrus oleraceus]|uniref:uncharacterized protein LOC127081169 n=1 Tax=Pisum sativum TaxID=3888 RepID=UPI0021CEA39E|nr:uncharacterized protein LOC127081169 [Pisum sativum]
MEAKLSASTSLPLRRLCLCRFKETVRVHACSRSESNSTMTHVHGIRFWCSSSPCFRLHHVFRIFARVSSFSIIIPTTSRSFQHSSQLQQNVLNRIQSLSSPIRSYNIHINNQIATSKRVRGSCSTLYILPQMNLQNQHSISSITAHAKSNRTKSKSRKLNGFEASIPNRLKI